MLWPQLTNILRIVMPTVSNAPKLEPFTYSPDAPLADAHAAVTKWVEQATKYIGDRWYEDVPLKLLDSGKPLFEADPQQARRYVLAAVVQTEHYDRLADKVRDQADTYSQRINAHHLPGWSQVWPRRQQAAAVVSNLMRRKLPFQRDDLAMILRWANQIDGLNTSFLPIGHIARALEQYASAAQLDEELRDSMRRFGERLRTSYGSDAKRYGTTIEQLCARAESATLTNDEPAAVNCPAPKPALAGNPRVLVQLKRLLGLTKGPEDPDTIVIDPDRFPLRQESPLRTEHELLSQLFDQLVGTHHYHNPDLRQIEAAKPLLQLTALETGRALLAAAERHVNGLLTKHDYNDHRVWQSQYSAAGTASYLLRSTFELAARDDLFDLLLYLSIRPDYDRAGLNEVTARLIALAERTTDESPLTEGERYVLLLYRASLVSGPPLGNPSENVKRLTSLIGDGASFFLAPGESWTDTANDDLSRLNRLQRMPWYELLTHALTATSARPSAKWLRTAAKLVADIGDENVCAALLRWLPLVAKGRSLRKVAAYAGDSRADADVMNQENATCLRGLLWLAPTLPRKDELTRAISTVAQSAYKKVPGVGPRAVKVGNAAVYALAEIGSSDAVGQLAMLKVRVKFGMAQKEIEKAFNKAAESLGLPRDQIEELGIPSYGLEEVGVRREAFGDYRAELTLSGCDAEMTWFDAKGKALKSVPAKVRTQHKEDLKELQQSLKDIQGMLPAQRDRIDGMYLSQKSWPIASWRERYLNHPLIGTIARRLLWCVDGTPALFDGQTPTEIGGNSIAHGETAEITLWHPIGHTVDDVLAWRQRLEGLGIRQPFKQAHREVYLLTDAERTTNTYSNRFAAHIIRQHQFNALCAARRWKNKLRLLVDDVYPPAVRELPQWGLRAEFWIEGVGQDYGVDTNDAGVFLRLATDQVRFYRLDAADNTAHAGGGRYASRAGGAGQQNINDPLPLDQVPPLVFSEIMRDVDLFVGVASVGNDPSWQDGGPGGRYRDYWQSYSFGELSGTAATRKQVLERLVPRLRIADRCSLSDRFLVVRGDKRTYKIHLGSSNILMEPNDQYLCIVPDARSRAGGSEVFLPFEGDATLSIIISKALLLAEDTKIKDPTITRQINCH